MNGDGKLVSIIIPVYNREHIVPDTVRSILKQTYQEIEVLIVDDGSTDRTYEVCEELTAHDGRVHVLKKENGGVSSARNVGLDKATGQYIFFLDSDDWLEEETIEKLVQVQEAFACDIAQGNYYVHEQYAPLETVSLTYYEYFPSPMYEPVVWGKLYRAEILREIRFDEGLEVREDIDFLYRLTAGAKTIVCLNRQYVHYENRDKGLNDFVYCEKNFLDIEVLERAIGKLGNAPEAYRNYLMSQYFSALIYHYVMSGRYLKNAKKIKKDIRKKYRRNFQAIRQSYNGRKKVLLYIAWISPAIYAIKIRD